MGGMASVFKKIIPFVFIICLVTFGIDVIFNGQNLTYLSKTTINGITQYNFDFANYIKNINFKNIKSAVTNVIDIKTLTNLIDSFRKIWANGYDLGDISLTIISAIILVINIILTSFNILLIPLRLIGGILLTALSILGIDISNTENPIVNLLKGLLNLYRKSGNEIKPLIPLIPWKYDGGTSSTNGNGIQLFGPVAM